MLAIARPQLVVGTLTLFSGCGNLRLFCLAVLIPLQRSSGRREVSKVPRVHVIDILIYLVHG